MRYQAIPGYRWLKEGRIGGMNVLVTSNVDIGLEAVDWTRRWIHANGNQEIPLPSTPMNSPPKAQ